MIVVALGNELLPHVHRKDEGPSSGVVSMAYPRHPGDVCEAADGLAELGAYQHQGVALVVALIVEGSCTKAVLGCPVELLDFDWIAEDVFQEL